MKKLTTAESGLFTPRTITAFALCSIGVFLAALSFAADPAGGTVTPSTAAPVTWQGTASGIPPQAAEECIEGENCDSFKLTIAGTPEEWAAAKKHVKVRIEWLANTTDYDLEVRKGSINGPVVASSGAAATSFEQVILNPRSNSIGTGDFYIRAAYFAATQADQYSGIAVVEDAGPAPIPAVQPSTGIAPRYQNHTPPPAGPATLGLDAAEPSIGVNWTTEGVLPGKGDDRNGGRSMYIALQQTLRVTFDDSCPSSPSSLWEDKSFPTTSAITFDPILFTDNTRSNPTGRTIVSQLIFPAGSVTTASAFTDNDGETWIESTGAGIGAGIDHQTIGGGGPFREDLTAVPPVVPPPHTYPNAIYYCAQLPASSCALSVDGGQTFGPAVPAYTEECGGLHGHIKVGPDGTAYLPNKGCSEPIPGQAVVVSEDNGVTWHPRPVPGSLQSGSDAAVGIGRGDKTNGRGRVYLGYADGDGQAVIATSTNRGKSWSKPVDVGAIFGINNVAFPTVVAGDDDRAAFAFYGTPTAGGLQDPKFNGEWHLYVAHTYDGGKTWFTVDATPNDPMQRGCIWLGGGSNICRNMLDFMGIDVDKRGRVLVAYNDGCAGAECSQAKPDAVGNSYTALAVIARQTGGKGLFAEHDDLFPDTTMLPGAPQVTALRNGGSVKLAWSQSNDGGSAIKNYTILRGTSSGAVATLATVPGTQLSYEDTSASDSNATYFYQVRATNAKGQSCGNNEVIARYVGDSHSPAGYTIYNDPTGASEPASAANPDLDIERLSIVEPSAGPHAGKIMFKLKVASLQTVPNNRMWRIIWDSPNAVDITQDPPANVGQFYVGMTKDATGNVTFEYGTVETAVVGLVVGRPRTRRIGDADAGNFTPGGMITIVMSKDKIGRLRRGDLMGNFAVRTFPADTEEVRTSAAVDQATNATANDLTANAATYQVVGPGAAELRNISTRAIVQTGEGVLIGGFIITGNEPKRVLIRGLGPSLRRDGVTGVLADPKLELHNRNLVNSLIASNDNWKETQAAAIRGTGIPPRNDAESAIVQTLAPGAYTAVLSGKGDASGVSLVEIYDLAPKASSQLVNLSSRGSVQRNDNVMIGGFIVGPDGRNTRVLVRAIGPSLTEQGVAGALNDPTLALHDGNGNLLVSNDDWQSNQEGEIRATGIPPKNPRESAILHNTAAGNYTAIVRGKSGTGVGLVEVYNVP